MYITIEQAEKYCNYLQEEFDFKIRNIESNDLKYLRRALRIIGVHLEDFDGITMFNRVYLRDMRRMSPHKLVGIMSHEVRHIWHGRSMGWGKFYSRYVFSLKWRAKIEKNGFAGTVDYNRFRGRGTNWDRLDNSLKSYQIGPKRRRSIIKELKGWDIKHAQNPKKNNVMIMFEKAGCNE